MQRMDRGTKIQSTRKVEYSSIIRMPGKNKNKDYGVIHQPKMILLILSFKMGFNDGGVLRQH